jgi:tetratricopeptide (TPR) repeat protein
LDRQGRKSEALAALRKSIELEPKGGPAFNSLGLVLNGLGRTDEALAALRNSIKFDPKSAAPLNNLGMVLNDLGRKDEALAAYRKAIELDPKASVAFYNLGRTLNDLGRTDEAVAALHRSIELEPKGAPARRLLEEVLALDGRDPGRGDSHRRAIAGLTETAPDDHDAWNHAATLWAQTGDRAGYREHCRRMLDRFGLTTDPPIAERTAKACLILPLGGPEQEAACDLADRTVAMARGHWVQPWAEATQGLAHYRRERYGDAVAAADRCLSRGSGRWWNRELPAHLVRAMALARLSRLDEARAALASASDLYRTQVANPGGRGDGGDWHDQVIGEILCREAEALLLDLTLPADPFAR